MQFWQVPATGASSSELRQFEAERTDQAGMQEQIDQVRFGLQQQSDAIQSMHSVMLVLTESVKRQEISLRSLQQSFEIGRRESHGVSPVAPSHVASKTRSSLSAQLSQISVPEASRQDSCPRRVYMCGNCNEGSIAITVATIDSSTVNFRCLSTGHIAHGHFYNAIVVGGKVYVMGGLSEDEAYGSCECFDPVTESWEVLPHMPTARGGCGVATLFDSIFMICGYDCYSCLPVVESFNTRSASWSIMPPLSTGRWYPAATSLDSFLYVVGGLSYEHGALATCQCFNPHCNSWTEISPMGSPRTGCAVTNVGNKICVYGGNDGIGHLSSGELYDPVLDYWTQLKPMTSPRAQFLMVCVEKTLYVFGGSSICGEVLPPQCLKNAFELAEDWMSLSSEFEQGYCVGALSDSV